MACHLQITPLLVTVPLAIAISTASKTVPVKEGTVARPTVLVAHATVASAILDTPAGSAAMYGNSCACRSNGKFQSLQQKKCIVLQRKFCSWLAVQKIYYILTLSECHVDQ